MKVADRLITTKMAMIFGTKVSVISWICVSACKSGMMAPTSIEAATDGPEATMIVQIAPWTMSSASASFISADGHAAGERDGLAAGERGRGAGRGHRYGGDVSGHAAVGRGDGVANDRIGLGERRRGHHGVELGVRLDLLLDLRERSELRDR